jgi:hypothetical protein
MIELIESAGRHARQRTTLYGEPEAERVLSALRAAPLAPLKAQALRATATL